MHMSRSAHQVQTSSDIQQVPEATPDPGAPVPQDGHDALDGTARIAELEEEVRLLREEAARSRLILGSAIDYAIITLDPDGRITSWNAGAERIIGYSEAEILGRSGDVVFTSDDRAEGKFVHELCRALEAGSATNERWHLRRDGTRFWASGTMMPMLATDGTPAGFLNILRDRTEARAEVERRELLMAEMNHRIKNTLSTVQAVAAHTGRHAPTIAEFLSAFGSRLSALARSHEVLIRGGWEEAPLRDIVDGALAAYGGEPGRVTVHGASVMVAANLAVTVSLAFHELATNAAKHGALSVVDGGVDVSWTITLEGKMRRVEIVWREHGGPPVRAPERRGFGFQLLQRGIGGAVRLAFPPEGLECRMSLPLGTGS
jgi:PAS domain S-box-containing protein